MRFGRHLKEVLVPGNEDACVRYDDLKVAIKTQLTARWGGDAGVGTFFDASSPDPPMPSVSLLEEGLLVSETEDTSQTRASAFYDLLAFEIARVGREYDACTATTASKVRSLLREARRNDVLDALQMNDDGTDGESGDDTADAAHAWLATSLSGSWPAHSIGGPSQNVNRKRSEPQKQQIDRAFKHVYRDVLTRRHGSSLNYSGFRKIVKKYLKKTCQVHLDGYLTSEGEVRLLDDLRELMDVVSDACHGLREGELRVDSGVSAEQTSFSSPVRPARPGGVPPPGVPPSSSHDILQSPTRVRQQKERSFKEHAARVELAICAKFKTLRFCAGAELEKMSATLEASYAAVLDLDGDSCGGKESRAADLSPDETYTRRERVIRVARRRLRLMERPAPAVVDRVSSFSGGIIFCALVAVALLWGKGKSTNTQVVTFTNYIPAFRLTAIPIIWLWCWATVTHKCTTNYINYRYIMEISATEEAGWHWNAALASVLTAAWSVCFALFVAKIKFGVDVFFPNTAPAYYPLGLGVFVIMSLVVPPSSIFAAAGITGGNGRNGADANSGIKKKTLHFFSKIVNPYARASLVRSIGNSICAPFGGHVRFRDNLVADVACSLVRCLVDFEYTTRLFVTGAYEKNGGFDDGNGHNSKFPISPIITCLPYWFRLQQCVRRFYDAKRGSRERVEHVVNAGKYVVSLVAICLASAGQYTTVSTPENENESDVSRRGRHAWLFFLCLGTLYAYLWDIVMDWGLLEVSVSESFWGEMKIPRLKWATTRDRVFHTRTFYAWAVFSNFVGRLAWAVTVTPRGVGVSRLAKMSWFFGDASPALLNKLSTETVGTIVAAAELLRRAQWTFLRLENEYLNNAARYRGDVAAPMLLDDVAQTSWAQEWKFSREQTHENNNTKSVYLVVAANALVAFGVAYVFYLVYSR